ncbi:unnamed protein product [[Candida] boidinii]|nr:unnamed protein product [[Candida] boidinii]
MEHLSATGPMQIPSHTSSSLRTDKYLSPTIRDNSMAAQSLAAWPVLVVHGSHGLYSGVQNLQQTKI